MRVAGNCLQHAINGCSEFGTWMTQTAWIIWGTLYQVLGRIFNNLTNTQAFTTSPAMVVFPPNLPTVDIETIN